MTGVSASPGEVLMIAARLRLMIPCGLQTKYHRGFPVVVITSPELCMSRIQTESPVLIIRSSHVACCLLQLLRCLSLYAASFFASESKSGVEGFRVVGKTGTFV